MLIILLSTPIEGFVMISCGFTFLDFKTFLFMIVKDRLQLLNDLWIKLHLEIQGFVISKSDDYM